MASRSRIVRVPWQGGTTATVLLARTTPGRWSVTTGDGRDRLGWLARSEDLTCPWRVTDLAGRPVGLGTYPTRAEALRHLLQHAEGGAGR